MKIYTMKEAAEELGMSFSWLDYKARDGKIIIVWMGGKRIITQEELDRIKRDGVK